MKVESWQAYNPDAKIKDKLGNCLRISYRKMNTIIDDNGNQIGSIVGNIIGTDGVFGYNVFL